MYAAWLDDFASRDVESVGFGIITLHRPATDRPQFVDLMDVRGPVGQDMGATVAAGLSARERLAGMTDDEVLDETWVAAPDVTIEQRLRPGSSEPRAVTAVQGGGLRLRIALGTGAAAYLGVADGSLTPRQALVAVAALIEEDAADVMASTVPTIRYLVANGLLVS
jgi:hypothetical protein